MSILDIIASRRSIKEFTSRPVGREEIERLLDAAVTAPNHRLTQPWRFYVLGPEARRAYGRVLGARKAARIEDPEAGRAVARKVEEAHAALPAMIVVTVVLDDDPEIREEDYAAAFMAIQNMGLAAHALGLGTHLKTGAVMADRRAREAVGVPADERIVAALEVGEPAGAPEPKPRRRAPELTRWLP